MSRSTVQKIERGDAVSRKSLRKVAEALGMDLVALDDPPTATLTPAEEQRIREHVREHGGNLEQVRLGYMLRKAEREAEIASEERRAAVIRAAEAERDAADARDGRERP